MTVRLTVAHDGRFVASDWHKIAVSRKQWC